MKDAPLVLLLIISCTAIPHDIQKRAVIEDSVLDLVQTGTSVKEAQDGFDKTKESYAKLYAKLTNLSNYTLSLGEQKNQKGESTVTPNYILPGYEEAWAAKQTKPLSRTEGSVEWNIPPDEFFFVEWNVLHQKLSRKPNKLVAGILPRDINNLEELIEDVKNDPESHSEYMTYEEYEKGEDLPTIQRCNDLLCMQAIMSSSHHATVNVTVIPINATDVAPTMVDVLDQATIDHLLQPEYFCTGVCDVTTKKEKKKSSLSREGLIVTITCSVAAVIIICCACLCCYLRNKE